MDVHGLEIEMLVGDLLEPVGTVEGEQGDTGLAHLVQDDVVTHDRSP